MTDQGTPQDSDGPPTQAWLTGRLARAYHLSEEDRRAATELVSGTAMLVGVSGPVAGARILLCRPAITVGRATEALVWLSAASVSRQHALLERQHHGYAVVDLGSFNGTYVNGERVERAQLQHGDEVQFGSCRFLYFAGASARPSAGPQDA